MRGTLDVVTKCNRQIMSRVRMHRMPEFDCKGRHEFCAARPLDVRPGG